MRTKALMLLGQVWGWRIRATARGSWGLFCWDHLPLCPSLTEQATALSGQSRSSFLLSCQRPSLWAFWIFNDIICLPRKRARRRLLSQVQAVVECAACQQQGCGWHGADWLVISPPGASPNWKPRQMAPGWGCGRERSPCGWFQTPVSSRGEEEEMLIQYQVTTARSERETRDSFSTHV